MKKSNKLLVSFGEDDVLWQLLRRTTKLIGKVRVRELKQWNIQADAAVVLFTLIRQGERATAASVARELLLESHSVSEQFTRMEKKGLIRRKRDLQNKKYINIEITRKGYDTYFTSAEQESTRFIMSALSKSEQKKLWNMLVKIRGKALQLSAMKKTNYEIYPPSDPSQLGEDLSNVSNLAEAHQETL